MIVRRPKVCAVRWVNRHFPAKLRQLLARDIGDMGSCLLVKEADGPVILACIGSDRSVNPVVGGKVAQ